MERIAFDFETYYDDQITLKTMGNRGYVEALPLEDIYRVTFAGSDGYRWVGHPKDADWSVIVGKIALAHNAGFEQEVIYRLRALGVVIPEFTEYHDTADLAAYCGHPRSLAGASYSVFKEVKDKTIRDVGMKGKHWNDLSQEEKEALDAYALDDSVITLRLWDTLSHLWPENERIVSRLSRQWASKGIQVDEKKIDEGIASLTQTRWEAERNIPWVLDGLKPLSKKALGLACREVGIPMPISLALDDENIEKWLEEYGEKYPWVMAMRNWRRSNAILAKLEAIKARTHDKRLRYDIKYWGAGMTGRWSGAGGVNIQNLSGKELFGVNMREIPRAAPGNVLIAADLAQIEPRVACFLSGEKEAMAQMAAGVSPYIVYARQAMGLGADETWAKSDPRYKVAKISVLGASYCAGHHRFMGLMNASGMEDILLAGPENPNTQALYLEYLEAVGIAKWIKIWRDSNEVERNCLLRSWEIIMTFRNGRPKLIALWNLLKGLAAGAADKNEDLELALPSGRSLVYKKLRRRRIPIKEGGGTEIVGDIVRNGQPQTSRIHQGILIENLCQAIARDAFRDCMLNVSEVYPIIFHVHDELITEVPVRQARQAKKDILRIMGTPPAWAPSLPVEAEATIAMKYSDAK